MCYLPTATELRVHFNNYKFALYCKLWNRDLKITSVPETIRKSPLVKAQTALKKQKINKIWRKTIFNMADGIITPCNMACGSGIMTVNSPSRSTLQCDTWVWDHDIEFATWQHPAMWQVAMG